MRNDSIVRSLEMLTGKQTFRSNCPELMGAIGCALYAKQLGCTRTIEMKEMLQWTQYTSKQLQCRGCENQCAIMRYTFNNENHYFSGNRCEKVYSNKGSDSEKGVNTYNKKLALLFDRNVNIATPVSMIGIPRILNMYEEYPFWHTLFYSLLTYPFLVRNLITTLFLDNEEDFTSFLQEWKQHIITELTNLLSNDK